MGAPGGGPGGRRVRQVATVLFPCLFTAGAFIVLSRFHLVGGLPLWVVLPVLVLGGVVGELTGGLVTGDASTARLHLGIAAQVTVVSAIIYMIGWGPTLTVGYIFVVSRALDGAGSRAWRVVLGWTVVGITLGQVAVATGAVESYVPAPYVHGLAGLGVLGSAIIMRLLGLKTEENEIAQAHLEDEVRERRAVDIELRSTLSLLKATLDSTTDGILVVDRHGAITECNARFLDMWALPVHLRESADYEAAMHFVLGRLSDPSGFLAKIDELDATPDAESYDTVEFTDGRVFERYSRPQQVDGEIVGRVWSFRDATARNRLEKQLVHQAFHDVLTGLANKALFRDRLDHAISRAGRSGHGLAVLFLDLDNFKTVNDSLGHAAGDELLGKVARLLHGCARSSDTVARLGGDEFAILMEDVSDIDDAMTLAQRFLAALRRPITLGSTDVAATASIGIAYHLAADTSEQLLRNADLAMYTAKERGKNRCVVFEPAMHTASAERLALESDLRRALVHQELAVHFQPIVDIAGEARLVGFEALVRWQHPIRGLLGPDVFIPVAEDAGLIEAVDRHVLAEAVAQAGTWPRTPDGDGYSISVNVSARRLLDPSLVGDVATAVGSLSPSGGSLVLEITESAVMRDTEAAIEQLDAVRALGVRVALDDFGTGYSSLSHLRRLPIDVLKIDRSFVNDLTDETEHSGIATAVLQLARNMDLGAVAEGVESAEQLARLRALGFRHAQGYFLGRPADAAATRRLLDEVTGAAVDPGAAEALVGRR